MNLPIVYMGYIDGHGYDWDRVAGSFLTDAYISIAVCLFLCSALPRWRRGAPAAAGAEGVGERAD